MNVDIQNDGPVTINIDSPMKKSSNEETNTTDERQLIYIIIFKNNFQSYKIFL